MPHLTVNTSLDRQQRQVEYLLAQKAAIDAQLLSFQNATSPSYPQPRTPIHKQPHRRSHVPRSMSNIGSSTMTRRPSASDRIEVPAQRQRSFSQRSAHSMARANSKGTSSQQSGNLPFKQTGAVVPPLYPQENPAMMAWKTQEQPLSSYTLSHQPHQPLQRSTPQHTPALEQIGEDPSDFISRTMGTPLVALSPSMPSPRSSATINHGLSISSLNHSPSTPDTLTTATTLTSNMSRQNSAYGEGLLDHMQMMKVDSQRSYSTDFYNDRYIYGEATHSTCAHSRQTSNEDRAVLLAHTGGASHESHFPHPFTSASVTYGERMEKSRSNESTSSTSSRNVKRLQDQINCARPIMPKGGSEGMSRDNSSQSVSRLDSKDGSADKVAIAKPTYQRPKHDRVYCKQCDSHPEGFRGEHELRRHQDREHKRMVKKFVCIEPTDGGSHPKPLLPLARCKACAQQKKKYGAYYNAAAHLRRAHFNPKSKGKAKNTKTEENEKRGGKGGGDWPTMLELKFWMKEVEEQAPEFSLADAQQEAADVDDDDCNDNAIDEQFIPRQHMPNVGNSGYDNAFIADTTPIFYPPTVNLTSDIYNVQSIPFVDMSGASQLSSRCMDQSMYHAPIMSAFPTFSPNLSEDELMFYNTDSPVFPLNSEAQNFRWT